MMVKARTAPARRTVRPGARRAGLTWSAMVLLGLVLGPIPGAHHAAAETAVRRLTLKSGESVEVESVYWTVNCKSTMIGLPKVEILEGPPGITFTIKEEQVVPVRAKCPGKVPGGKLMVTAASITEPAEVRVTVRLKFKTLDGERQRADSAILMLQP